MARRDGLPFVIYANRAPQACDPLTPVPFTETRSEEWLQDLLDRAPQLLPIRDVDERVDVPLTSLGREVATPAGPIDNLFISRNGYLVVVETKLWRNPEARRQVVAQLIDYAAQLRRWRYADIDNVVREGARTRGRTLWEVVSPEGIEEPEWVDRVSENLARGRMTLLVVGDGIRSEAEALADLVGNRPDFHFRLALVEMRVFRLASGDQVVIPATLARTSEIERAVVRIEQGGGVTVEMPTTVATGSRRVLSEEVLRDELRRQPNGAVAAQVAERLLQLLEAPFQIAWGSGSFAVKVPDPGGSGRLLSLCVVASTATLYAYVSWLREQLTELWGDKVLVNRVSEAHIAVLRKYGAKVSASGKQHDIKLASLAGREKEFVADLVQLVSLIERIGAERAQR